MQLAGSAVSMLHEAQGIRRQIKIMLPQVWLGLVPGPAALSRLLLFPQLLRQLPDEAVAIVRGAEAMPAHPVGSKF